MFWGYSVSSFSTYGSVPRVKSEARAADGSKACLGGYQYPHSLQPSGALPPAARVFLVPPQTTQSTEHRKNGTSSNEWNNGTKGKFEFCGGGGAGGGRSSILHPSIDLPPHQRTSYQLPSRASAPRATTALGWLSSTRTRRPTRRPSTLGSSSRAALWLWLSDSSGCLSRSRPGITGSLLRSLALF